MLTPKETSGGGLPVYPVDIPCSALLEAGYSSSGALAADAAIALSFKPTAADPAHALCDPTNHYLLLVVKTGATVEVFRNGVSLGSYATTAATCAGLLSEALAAYCGSDHGYYSNLHVVDGAGLSWSTFFELSDQVADLWMWKDAPDWAAPSAYVTGDRTADIAATATFAPAEGAPATLLDGITSGYGWYPSSPVAGQYLQFVFDEAVVITEMTVHSSTTATRGQWKWQGSADGVDGWADLTASWTLGGGTAWADASLNGNGTAYKGYRLVLTENSGQLNAYWFEMEFKVEGGSKYGVNGGLYAFADSAALGADSSGQGNHWTVTGTQSDDTPTHNGGLSAWNAMGAPKIRNASLFADLVLRPGTGAAATVDSLGFPPDLVNIKDRSSVHPWHLYDTARGAAKSIGTSSTAVETTVAEGLTAFGADGYALGADADHNASGNAFLDLALKAAPVAGFNIVTWTGDGVIGREIAHGLGAVPTFIMVKRLDLAADWSIYHAAIGNGYKLEFTDEAKAATGNWNWTDPTATAFTVGQGTQVNTAGNRYVAYAFADSDVFKAFSYIGNNTTDGPEADLGGRPLAIPFLKNADSAVDWACFDAVRDPHNPVDLNLRPNATDAEDANGLQLLAFRANGVKPVSATALVNGSGKLHVGLAVLRQPYKYSNAF